MIKLERDLIDKTNTIIHRDGTKEKVVVGKVCVGYKYKDWYIDRGAVGFNVYRDSHRFGDGTPDYEYDFSARTLAEARISIEEAEKEEQNK